jgi:hypothetical protein
MFDSEYSDLQVLMSWQLADTLLMPCKCYSAYILYIVQFMYVYVTHALHGGSHVASILQGLYAHM